MFNNNPCVKIPDNSVELPVYFLECISVRLSVREYYKYCKDTYKRFTFWHVCYVYVNHFWHIPSYYFERLWKYEGLERTWSKTRITYVRNNYHVRTYVIFITYSDLRAYVFLLRDIAYVNTYIFISKMERDELVRMYVRHMHTCSVSLTLTYLVCLRHFLVRGSIV